ncbi:MAG: phosphate acyltransferase, partial [Streptococcus thermophilus]
MRSLFGELREHISGKGVRIVFPEGNDDRVVRAAARLKFEELVDPIILGDPTEVHKIGSIISVVGKTTVGIIELF